MDKDPEQNYADIEAYCQVFHSCMPMGEDLENVKLSRLCPNGTIYDQVTHSSSCSPDVFARLDKFVDGGILWTATELRHSLTLKKTIHLLRLRLLVRMIK